MTKVLSKEHRENIAKAVKARWKRGDFNLESIREKWRQTALNGIAKKGKPNIHKFVPSKEMMDDYSLMGDLDLSSKYGVSRKLIMRIRKEYNLPRFNNKHGTYPHEFKDGKEYKWCGSGHWELVENFRLHSSRYDGLRGHCKAHANKMAIKSHTKINNTEEGKAKIRFQNNRRKTAIILWEYQDEKRAMQIYEKRCGYCGTEINYKTVEFDHILPVSKGGKTIPENMIPSCVECNRGVNGKHTKDIVSWLHSKFGEDIGDFICKEIQRKQTVIAQETKERLDILSQLGE